MHRIMDCQQLPSVSQSIFQSSFLVQLVIPTPSEVLLLSLLSLSLSLSSLKILFTINSLKKKEKTIHSKTLFTISVDLKST